MKQRKGNIAFSIPGRYYLHYWTQFFRRLDLARHLEESY
jgi:hypothetical protein